MVGEEVERPEFTELAEEINGFGPRESESGHTAFARTGLKLIFEVMFVHIPMS